MEAPNGQETNGELEDQAILLAASNHEVEVLRKLLRKGSANVQDPETGFTPLHAAIAACGDETHDLNPAENPNSDDSGSRTNEELENDIEAAAKTLKLLLQNGAIWNDVDRKNETPGCLALRLGFRKLYDIMVDAGVRAEMLLNRLDEYEQLAESDEEDAEGEVDAEDDVNEQSVEDDKEARSRPSQVQIREDELSNEEYLQSTLHFQDGRILDDANNGVMMAWETEFMRRTADRLAPKMGLRILNIGHGLGIIDTFFQETYPSAHHIIEAHPAVIARMRRDGWDKKENVVIHEGRWQDIIPKLIENEDRTLFDAIYFDTFAEDYKALRDFFSDSVVGLLDERGKWGFFNGLGADRQICYDVYGKVVEMDLFEAGFDTEWETLPVEDLGDEEWQGVKRRYWTLKEYKLPICTFIP